MLVPPRNQTKKKDALESELYDAVDQLRDDAMCAMDSSATILRDQEIFAHEMAEVLKYSGEHPTGDFYRPKEAIAIADSIQRQSELLSEHTDNMISQLDVVLELVDKIKHKRERKILWRKVLKWLTRAFKVLATILTVGAFVLPILHPIGVVGSAALGVGATLATYASTLCTEIHDCESLLIVKRAQYSSCLYSKRR